MSVDGKLRAFDPGRKTLEWIVGDVALGGFIEAVPGQPPYLVTAIVPAADFVNCNSYQKLRNLYASGGMGCAEFKVNPCES